MNIAKARRHNFELKLRLSSTFTRLMKANRVIHRSSAIILLLIFGQKIGVELYLHNCLHTSNSKQFPQHTPVKNVVSYSCNCLDDFSMPFAENVEPLAQTIFSTEVEFIAFQKFSTPSSSIFFYSLRGPPVSIA